MMPDKYPKIDVAHPDFKKGADRELRNLVETEPTPEMQRLLDELAKKEQSEK